MERIKSALAAALLAFPLTGLAAQSQTSLTGLEGKKVRVSIGFVDKGEAVGSMDLRGTLVAFRGDSIQVLENGGSVTVIPVSRVQSIKVSEGRDRWAGAKIGAIVGAGFGLLMSASPPECENGRGYDCRRDGSTPNTSQWLLLNVGDGMWMGGMIGAIVGTERWRPVIGMRPAVPASSPGTKFGLRLSF
jgi:hypothetical protein